MPANFLEMARMAISMHAYHKICLMVKDIRGLETFQWRDIFQESSFEILMIAGLKFPKKIVNVIAMEKTQIFANEIHKTTNCIQIQLLVFHFLIKLVLN